MRASGLDYTIVKPVVVYGHGDHMLDHLSHAFYTFPVFGFVGFDEKRVRPVAVADLVQVMLPRRSGTGCRARRSRSTDPRKCH